MISPKEESLLNISQNTVRVSQIRQLCSKCFIFGVQVYKNAMCYLQQTAYWSCKWYEHGSNL